jgi:hypothetical protein
LPQPKAPRAIPAQKPKKPNKGTSQAKGNRQRATKPLQIKETTAKPVVAVPHEQRGHFAKARRAGFDGADQLRERIKELSMELRRLKDQLSVVAQSHPANLPSVADLTIDHFAACITQHWAGLQADSALVRTFGFSRVRARKALRESPISFGLVGQDLLHSIFGYPISAAEWDVVQKTSTMIGEGCPTHESGVLIKDLLHSPEQSMRMYIDHIPTNDTPSILIAAGLMANFRDSIRRMSSMMDPLPPYSESMLQALEPPFLALAFTIDRAMRGYLVGESGIHDESADWLHAAPWIFPFIESPAKSATALVTDYLALNGRRCAVPGTAIFEIEASTDWVERVRNTAGALGPLLKQLPRGVHHFQGPDFEIVLAAQDGMGVAWVGKNETGLLTSFDTKFFLGVGLPDPNQALALGLAICWFVDCAIGRGRQINLARSRPPLVSPGRTSSKRYAPSPSFARHRNAVRIGRNRPPTAHFVAAHIRHLSFQQPNLQHVNEAPIVLRARMGRNDTWVRAHVRGVGNARELHDQFKKSSMLAAFLGLLDAST